ncbi:MAG: sigma-70 family RNA polymerase sigma factor [Lachnospiraceae bacterium]
MQEVTEIGKKRKRGVVEPLYVSYYDEIYQYAFSLLENVHDAEDAVHTVFLHVVNRWRDLSSAPKQEVRNFLYKAVRNASLDIMRRRACYREIPLDSLEAQERLACYMTRGVQEIFETLNQLPRWNRNILAEAYVFGYTSGELAEEKGMEQNAIERRLDRAKGSIRGLRRTGIYW